MDRWAEQRHRRDRDRRDGHLRGLTPLSKGLADLPDEEQDILLKVADVLRRIEFGTVVLTVQDGRVVQIEMAEKFRLR